MADTPKHGSRTILVGFVGLAAVAVAAVALVSLRRVEPLAPPAAAVSQPPEPGPRKVFTLFIDSTPSGATVVEHDNPLGNTPLQISVDNEAARRELRKLTVRREGFQPYSILQGPSEDNVRVHAQLVEIPSEPPAPKGLALPPTPARPARVKPVAAPPEPTAQPSAQPPPVARPSSADIRLQR